MARYKDRQTAFSKGELAPGMRGRTDLAAYAHGCRTLKNFFVTPHGGAANRAGTEHICNTVSGGEYKCRKIPFVASDSQACVVLLMADPNNAGNTGTIQFVLDGALVGPTLIYPCTSAQLADIKYCQVGDVIVLVHPEIAPHELRRLASDFTDWSIGAVSFEVPNWPAYGGTPILADFYPEDDSHPALEWAWCLTRIMQTAAGRVYETAPRNVTLQARQSVYNWYDLGRNGHGVSIAADRNDPRYQGVAYMTGDIVWDSTLGTYYQAQQSVTADYNGSNGPASDDGSHWVAIALPLYDAISGRQVIYADRPNNIRWDGLYAPVTAGTAAQDRIIATRVYRGRQGRYGFVGETTQTWFIDEGQTPDFSYPPPQETSPFEVKGGDGVVIRTEEPSVVTHWNGRRFYANTAERPDWVWGSEVDNYYNFDVVVPPKDSDSLSFQLGTNKMEAIRALLPRRNLVLLTDSSEQIAGGAGDALMTPTSISAMPLSEHGSGSLAPLVFGDVVVFMQRKGTFPRALLASNERGGFQAIDIHSNSRHLFTGHTIVDWCYAEDPYSLIWAVRDDGALLSCAFNLEQELVAWSIHWLASGGLAESICSIPEGQEDAVYVTVLRGNTRRIERFTSRAVLDVRDACILDAAVRYDGRRTDPLSIVSGQALVSGALVSVYFSEDTPGMYLGNRIQVTYPTVTAEFTIHNNKGDGWYEAYLETDLTGVTSGDETTTWSFLVNMLSGLDHLGPIGTEVKAIIDGNVFEADSLNFDGSRVQFGVPLVPIGDPPITEEPTIWGAVVAVGLPYESDFESLDMAQERTKQKTVGTVHIETEGSRGGYVGVTLDDLEEIPQRDVGDNYAAIPLQYESLKVNIPSRWNESGRVAYRQSAPLPITILGITRDVEVGG